MERIEIVRGPGSVVWGSNAMNGVINIITRNAADTQGGKVNIAVGNELNLLTDVSYGDQSGDWAWRGYARYFDQDARQRDDFSSAQLPGTSINDAWKVSRMGIRADQQQNRRELLLSANVYDGDIDDLAHGIPLLNPARSESSYFAGEISGYDTILQWTQKINSHDQWRLRLFVDDSERRDVNILEQRSVYDVELQYNLQRANHTTIYGAGYRRYQGDTQADLAAAFQPPNDTTHLSNVFFRDDWRFTDNWRLSFGLKPAPGLATEPAIATGTCWPEPAG